MSSNSSSQHDTLRNATLLIHRTNGTASELPLDAWRHVGADFKHRFKRIPFECLEAGCQLEQLSVLLLLHSIMEELTNSVQLLVTQVAIGTEVEGQCREFHVDPTTSSA